MGLACVVLHNICIEKDDFIPRKLDWTFDDIKNKRRDSDDVRDILDLINTSSKNYLQGKADAISMKDALRLEFCKERENAVANAEEFWNIGIHEIQDSGNIFTLVYILHILLQRTSLIMSFLLFALFRLLTNKTWVSLGG